MPPTDRQQPDPRITKRRVTMRSARLRPDGHIVTVEAVDYVDAARPGVLEAYVADAYTRWDQVEVSDEPDAGPGGYDGQTTIPGHLDHPLAGAVFPATEEG